MAILLKLSERDKIPLLMMIWWRHFQASILSESRSSEGGAVCIKSSDNDIWNGWRDDYPYPYILHTYLPIHTWYLPPVPNCLMVVCIESSDNDIWNGDREGDDYPYPHIPTSLCIYSYIPTYLIARWGVCIKWSDIWNWERRGWLPLPIHTYLPTPVPMCLIVRW